MSAAIQCEEPFGSGNRDQRTIAAGAYQREVAFCHRIVHALPGFSRIERSYESVPLQGSKPRITRPGCILELQIANVSAIPIASGIVRSVKAHIRSDEKVVVIHATQTKISG